MSEPMETYQLCASLLDLGANGDQPREWLTNEHPGVRGCAALAPALADDPQARRVLADLCRTPRAFDRALGHGLDPASPALHHFAGPPHWALVQAACERTPDFRDLVLGALMALPHAFQSAPCPELTPYLRVAFPEGLPASTAATLAQLYFARELTERNELWQANDDPRTRTLSTLGLPTDRAAWDELATGPRRPYSNYGAAELTVLPGLLAVRQRPTMYLGEGIDRTHPEFLRRLYENLVNSHEQAAATGEISGYHLTIESDARVTLAVDGAALPAESRSHSPSIFTYMFTAHPFCRAERTEHLNRMAAFCSTVSARTWYGGQGYTQDFADMASIGPVRASSILSRKVKSP